MPLIEHISDTARWIAAIRAEESERPDALFFDPYSRELAGDQGFAIAHGAPHRAMMAWAMALRTRAIDDMILEAATEGFDCVVNLAAGLDSRAYRLDLPPDLHWIEIDLPAILDYKARTLRGAPPKCRLSQIALDLTDEPARAALFANLGERHRKVLVITEGLLVYLEPEQVASLARALHQPRSFVSWIFDFSAPAFLGQMRKNTSQMFAQSNAKFRFAQNDLTWFEPFGWLAGKVRSTYEDAVRLRRLFWWQYVFRFTSLIRSKAQNETLRKRYLAGAARMVRVDSTS